MRCYCVIYISGGRISAHPLFVDNQRGASVFELFKTMYQLDAVCVLSLGGIIAAKSYARLFNLAGITIESFLAMGDTPLPDAMPATMPILNENGSITLFSDNGLFTTQKTQDFCGYTLGLHYVKMLNSILCNQNSG